MDMPLNESLISKQDGKRYVADDLACGTNELFLGLFQASPIPFSIVDTSEKVHAFNAAFVKVIGYDLNVIKSLDDWWPKAFPDPEYRAEIRLKWRVRLAKTVETNQDFEPFDVVISAQNNQKLNMLIIATSLTSFGSDIFLVTFVNVRDVKVAQTQIDNLSSSLKSTSINLKEHKKQLEFERKKLVENEERLRLAMKGANDGLWDYNLLDRSVYFSPRWKLMLGYSEHELIDSFDTWLALLHEEDKEYTVQGVKEFTNQPKQKYQAEFRMKHKNGHYVNILSRAFAVEAERGKVIRIVGTHVDISAQKAIEAKLQYQSSHDELTGLINRREFENRANHLIEDSRCFKNCHALVYIDLDQFKLVNDICGHIAGDELLRQLSALLIQQIKPSDTLARLGGDEFGILMEHCSLEEALDRACSLNEAIREYQFAWQQRNFKIGASMGLVAIDKHSLSFNDLLKNADAACFVAKDKGRDCIHVHHKDDVELKMQKGKLEWATRINTALEKNQFCLYAQEIRAIDSSQKHSHYELLIRMQTPDGKTIPPGAFLPAAERYNLAKKIDRWVISEAISLLQKNAFVFDHVKLISINLSGQSLSDETLPDFVVQQLEKLEENRHSICFEITETAAITNFALATVFVNKLRAHGCKFSLDDFGSGLSSFAYLKNLSVDYLKIDGIFVKDISSDPIDRAMVKSIQDIAKAMELKTVAEFVENDEIIKELRRIGVDYAQGYGIHKPEAFESIIEKLK